MLDRNDGARSDEEAVPEHTVAAVGITIKDPRFVHSATPMAERRRGYQVLFLSLICVGMGQSLIFTILPPIARTIGLSEVQVASIFAVSAIFWIFSSPIWGRRSDYWGRKPVMLMGFAAFSVSLLLFAGAVHVARVGLLPLGVAFTLMIVTRTIYGMFGSGTFPAAQAYVADRTNAQERAAGMGVLGAAFGVGTIVGPAVGGALVVFGLLAPFYFTAVLAIFAAALVLWVLPERTKPVLREKRHKISITDSRVYPFVVFGVALSAVQAVMTQTVSFLFMDKLGLSPETSAQFVGVAMMASAMAALFAQLVLIQRFQLTARFLMRMGIGLAVAGNALFVIAPTYGTMVFAMIMLGGAFGMARPGFSAAASLSVRPEEQGAVAGLLGSTAASGHVISPLLVMLFYQRLGPDSLYMFNTVVMAALFSFIFIHPALREVREGSPEESREQADDAESVIPPS